MGTDDDLCPGDASTSGCPNAGTADEPDNHEQQDAADRGVDDRAADPRTEMNAQLRGQPVADEGADDPDDHVIDEPKTGPLHNVTRQPSGRNADQQNDFRSIRR